LKLDEAGTAILSMSDKVSGHSDLSISVVHDAQYTGEIQQMLSHIIE
jgi:hypothetical protein